MDPRSRRRLRGTALIWVGVLVAVVLTPADPAQARPTLTNTHPTISGPAAFDTSRPLREVAPARAATTAQALDDEEEAGTPSTHASRPRSTTASPATQPSSPPRATRVPAAPGPTSKG